MVTHLTDRQPAFERDIERRLWLAEQGLAEEIVLTHEEAAALQRRDRALATATENAIGILAFLQRARKGITSLFPPKQGQSLVREPRCRFSTPDGSPPR